MYLRAVHADATTQQLRQLILSNPLGILTTAIPSKVHPLLQSSHIPFLLDTHEDKPDVLRAHLARQNPQAKALIDHITSTSSTTLDSEVLIIFTSPVQHYVTPKFYTTTKPDSGKVVPTWNYAAVQVYGKAKVFCDSKSDETMQFLMKQISDLSSFAEEDVMKYDKAWKVSDAPERYIELLRKNIIGIEIEVERMEGKFKMSQEMGNGDRDGVVQGFEKLGGDVGVKMAELVKDRGEMKEKGR